MTARPTAPTDSRASAASASRPREEVGVCSTRPSDTGVTTTEAGCDTLRLLFETRSFGPHAFDLDGWRAGSMPAVGLTWVEGHPAPNTLASSEELAKAAERVRELVDEHFGVVRDRGVSRVDLTATCRFEQEASARAFLGGMAALDLPRCDTTRRGRPVHSVSWTHTAGRRILARCYDKGKERGGESFKFGRVEDQRRYGSSGRPGADVFADASVMRSTFHARFAPIWKSVEGVKAASVPVIGRALADELRFGYRTYQEAERLAGSLLLFSGGVVPGELSTAGRRTYYRRRAELREAGYVVAEDLRETVSVDLGEVLEAALDSPHWGAHG